MKRWLHYARPYTKYFIIGPLCMIVEVIGEIVLPRIYAKIIDTGVATQNVTYIVVACAIMVLTAILMMTGGIGLQASGLASERFIAVFLFQTRGVPASCWVIVRPELCKGTVFFCCSSK